MELYPVMPQSSDHREHSSHAGNSLAPSMRQSDAEHSAQQCRVPPQRSRRPPPEGTDCAADRARRVRKSTRAVARGSRGGNTPDRSRNNTDPASRVSP